MENNEVVKCPRCEGGGEIFLGTYGFEDNPILEVCPICKGFGVLPAMPEKLDDVDKLIIDHETIGN